MSFFEGVGCFAFGAFAGFCIGAMQQGNINDGLIGALAGGLVSYFVAWKQ